MTDIWFSQASTNFCFESGFKEKEKETDAYMFTKAASIKTTKVYNA